MYVKPVNTATLDGQSAVLHCRSDRGLAYIGWYRRLIGGAWERVANDGCDLESTFSSAYSVISDNRSRCDLVVNRTDISVIGKYSCYDGNEEVVVYLTVIGQLFSVLLDVFTDLFYENIN